MTNQDEDSKRGKQFFPPNLDQLVTNKKIIFQSDTIIIEDGSISKQAEPTNELHDQQDDLNNQDFSHSTIHKQKTWNYIQRKRHQRTP